MDYIQLKVITKFMRLSWGDNSAGKLLVVEECGPEFIPQYSCKSHTGSNVYL